MPSSRSRARQGRRSSPSGSAATTTRSFMSQRWKQKPPNSSWGEFGPDDQRGRMNYVTREKVLQGIAEVKEGITFCLSLPLDYPGGNVLNPRRSPPRLASTLRNDKQNFCYPLRSEERRVGKEVKGRT